jgi:hypothetical protein
LGGEINSADCGRLARRAKRKIFESALDGANHVDLLRQITLPAQVESSFDQERFNLPVTLPDLLLARPGRE